MVYEICHSRIFTAEEEAEILQIIAVEDPARERRFLERLRGVVVRFQMTMHDEQRSTIPQKRAKFEILENLLKKIDHELETMDPDSREDITQVASADPYNPQWEPGLKRPEVPRFMVDTDDRATKPKRIPASRQLKKFSRSLGGTRFLLAKYAIKQLRRWVIRAQKKLGPAKRGRPPQRALDTAAVEIRDAWTEATGKEPTLAFDEQTYGQFLELTKLALRRFAGEDAGFETACRRAAYGTNDKA